MKCDTKLVEQSDTQRRHWASASVVLKADYAQINHRQRFADHKSSFLHRARRASSVLLSLQTRLYPSLCQRHTKLVASGYHPRRSYPSPEIGELSKCCMVHVVIYQLG